MELRSYGGDPPRRSPITHFWVRALPRRKTQHGVAVRPRKGVITYFFLSRFGVDHVGRELGAIETVHRQVVRLDLVRCCGGAGLDSCHAEKDAG